MKDPLLNSLIYVSRYFGLANSPEALINGLPLSDGKLTPFLLPRAAERAGLVAKENRAELDKISSLILPAILLLKGGDSCVLNSIDVEKQEAEITTLESGMVPISIPLEDLLEQYTGRYFLVKKQFRYDERSPEVLKTKEGHWFGQPCGNRNASTAMYLSLLSSSTSLPLRHQCSLAWCTTR